MAQRNPFTISLAAKCRLLFGLAVALIITAALTVPWYALEYFVHDRNFQNARSMALLAHAWVDPASSDWRRQQELLNQWWSDNTKLLRLPEARPQLVPLSPTALAITPDPKTLARIRKWSQRAGQALPLQPNVTGELGALAWFAMPEDVRKEMLAKARAAGGNAFSVLQAPFPNLDPVQLEAIKDMRASDEVNEIPRTERQPGQPTIYRYLLAVRAEEPGSVNRRLVGIIDMKFPKQTEEALLVIRLVIILAGVLAGFLAILVFYLITQRLILAPVRELRGLAEQIAQGDLTARASVATGDEYEELGTAFNGMLEQLERSRGELEAINRSLDTRLGELAETNVGLYESNRLKSEFLANVSHELRTPLTSIIGFADLLRDTTSSSGPMDAGRAARYANNILTSGRMLLEIINDLLDLAKIEAGRIEIHRSVFSLVDLCDALADFMRPLVDKKSHTLELEVHEPLPAMNSDAGKIRQILYNLLSNAVKYTPEGGHILFVAEPIDDGERVRLTVTDNGPGIAEEDQQRIFEKFRQLDSSVTREHSGTGLGLAISRELCLMLGGTIHLESQLGRGAKFIVELPVECPEKVHRAMPSLT